MQTITKSPSSFRLMAGVLLTLPLWGLGFLMLSLGNRVFAALSKSKTGPSLRVIKNSQKPSKNSATTGLVLTFSRFPRKTP